MKSPQLITWSKSITSFVKSLQTNHYLITIISFCRFFSGWHGTWVNQKKLRVWNYKPKNSSNDAEISTICLVNRSSWIHCFKKLQAKKLRRCYEEDDTKHHNGMVSLSFFSNWRDMPVNAIKSVLWKNTSPPPTTVCVITFVFNILCILFFRCE